MVALVAISILKLNFAIPLQCLMQVSNVGSHEISTPELARLPLTFPHLKRLEVIYDSSDSDLSEGSLIELLIRQFCKLPTTGYNPPDRFAPNLSQIRTLFENHPGIPEVCFNREVTLEPNTMNWLNELITTGLKFKKIAMNLKK